MIRIRPAGPVDAGPLASVYTAAVRQLAVGHYAADQRHAWAALAGDPAAWRTRLEALNLLVAERLDQTAGFIGFRADGYIDLLFTAPAHARHGVARSLLALAEQELRRAGTGTLLTHASRVARPFFAQHGFRVVAAETAHLGELGLERFLMRKDAAAA